MALKVLNADPSSETGELRFIREIRMLARLQHPHIVPLHDSGHVEALLYYLMPYVSGETLRARMSRERQVPIDVAIRIACEAADALSYAHSHGVIHRDIKPENILLSGGHAVVADFGIARAIDVAGVQQLTHTGHGNPGTPAYMSPEQLMSGRQVDGRSDIYSLGCVLYEMLTGKPPFAGKEGFVKRFTELPAKPSTVRRDVPVWLDTVVLKTLACEPEDRFGRAEDLILALSGPTAIDPHPPTWQPETSGDPPRPTQQGFRETEQLSIGVLPFANMSSSPDNEYFSDGVTEEIRNALSRIPTLKVAARTSTFALKGTSLSIEEIGRFLNVKTILEGSVRRMGQRVRISVQLVSASDGYHIWSEQYDRELEDVFEIQAEIARNIVARLKVKLTAAQDKALDRRHTENVEAYELYLRGRHWSYRWNMKGMLDKAIGHYEQALAKDPEYALAYHGLADAYSLPGLWGFRPASEVLPKALAAATRAVELAPELAESRTSLGFVQLLSWDWEAAESSLLHAIDLNPRYAIAHSFHAWLLSTLGRQREAAQAARLGQELDPLASATNGIAALVSYHGRQYEQAIGQCERAIELDRTSFLALLAITLSYAAKGMYTEAITHAKQGVSLSPDVILLRALLAAVYAMAGDRAAAEGILAELLECSEQVYVGPTMISWIYSNLGEPDAAFDWLGKACSARDCTLGFGVRVPLYDRISADGRFQSLLESLGLRGEATRRGAITALPRVLAEAESKIIAGSNDFAFDLFRTVNHAQRKANVFISPLSASMALGMAANGANGATYDEMRSTLRLSGATREDVNSGYKSLITMLRGLDPGTKFSIANSIWYDQKLTFNASFMEEGKQYFGAQVQALNFKSPSAVTTINSWVSTQTNNRIPEILDGIDSSEVMLLVNAIYFRGLWQKQFDKSETVDAPFRAADGTITTVPMMARAAGVKYAAMSKYEAVDLPYGNSAFAMTVVLPNKSADIDAFAQSFNQSKWNSLVSSLRDSDRKVFLPRFRMEWKRLLNDDLQRLGMRLAFSNGDFTRMSPLRPSLVITRVLQKTFVDVDEEGTEAAASADLSVRSIPAAFRADRPFLVVIRERFSGAILFIGKIAKLPV